MSVIVVDFTFLGGRECEIVVKKLAVVDFHNKALVFNNHAVTLAYA